MFEHQAYAAIRWSTNHVGRIIDVDTVSWTKDEALRKAEANDRDNRTPPHFGPVLEIAAVNVTPCRIETLRNR